MIGAASRQRCWTRRTRSPIVDQRPGILLVKVNAEVVLETDGEHDGAQRVDAEVGDQLVVLGDGAGVLELRVRDGADLGENGCCRRFVHATSCRAASSTRMRTVSSAAFRSEKTRAVSHAV